MLERRLSNGKPRRRRSPGTGGYRWHRRHRDSAGGGECGSRGRRRRAGELVLVLPRVDRGHGLLLTYVLLTYFIVRPIDRLRLASERLAAGRLQTSVPIQGAAEVARLAATFNEMAAQLREDRAALQDRLEDLQRTTAELTTAQEQLVRSARLAAVGRLSAGVAHEIGNPLAGIRGLLDLMQTGDLDPEEEKEFIGRIQGEAERIHHTIRDLLDFSRNEPEPSWAGREPRPILPMSSPTRSSSSTVRPASATSSSL